MPRKLGNLGVIPALLLEIMVARSIKFSILSASTVRCVESLAVEDT